MIKINKADVKNNIFPHTQAKLDLYRAYVQNYLRILCNAQFCTQINLYDIFCGAGLYDDGKKGSPLITLDCIKEINDELLKKKLPIKKIMLTVNDNDAERIQKVKLNASYYKIENCTINYFNEDANKILEIVANQTLKCPKDHRNLVFIDPYGYSSINKDKIVNVLKGGYTEIILFLPIMQMYRFKEIAIYDENKVYEKLRDFIFSFSNSVSIFETNTVFDFIHKIKEALTINNSYYTCSHYIEREKGNYYAVFFITSNILGLEKMVEAKWKLDPSSGKGFNQDSKAPSLFGEELVEYDKMQEISYLETIILNVLGQSKKLSNCDIYKLAVTNEFLPKHAKKSIENLIRDNKINQIGKSQGLGISYKNYRDKNIMAEFERI
jgi:three-Cys-motif partner protein